MVPLGPVFFRLPVLQSQCFEIERLIISRARLTGFPLSIYAKSSN